MELIDIVKEYNDSDDYNLEKLLLSIANNYDMRIDSNIIHWFSEDVINKNSDLKPISVELVDNNYVFNSGNNCLFSMTKLNADSSVSLCSPLCTCILPMFDKCNFYFKNDQFITGDFGLYEDYSKFGDFTSYRYLTFYPFKGLKNEYYIDKTNGTMEKLFYDKSGVVDSKFIYSISMKDLKEDKASSVINKVTKFIDDNYPKYSKSEKDKLFYECIDGYFYDIRLTDKKTKYRDLYVSKKSSLYSKKNYDYFIESSHISGVQNRNIEKSFCKSSHLNTNIKLLCVLDFVNGFMLKNKIVKYPINEMQAFIDSITLSESKDDSVILNKYESKISEINKYMFEYIKKYKSKHAMRTKNRTVGAAFGSILVGNEKTFIFNCGDTRIYSLNDNELKAISNDDTVVWNMFKDNKISYDEAIQYQKGAKLTRFFGQSNELPRDILVINNSDYDKLFILSDGVTDSVNDSTLKTIISVNNDEDILDNIIIQANKNRSKYEDVTACCYSKKRG